jgi:hypothetical protein
MSSLLDPIFDTAGDGMAPDTLFADETENRGTDDAAATSEDDSADEYQGEPMTVDPTAPIPQGGKLLEEPKASKVFRAIDKEVQRQERLAKNREEEGRHWDRVKRGVPFSILEKSEDQSVYRAILPPGVEDVQQPIPNKVLDLCNKQVSQLLVDPPLPNPKPDGDSERNRGAMDLAKRFLRSDGDSSGTNDPELWREVLTLNRTRKSAFVFVWVDPCAGGWRPKQKKAHPQATDPANPLYGPALDDQGQPKTDPMTHEPIMERATDPVLRYVGEQGDKEVFVEHPAEAAREWLPKHRRKVIHPNQVRTLPATATAFEAHSIIVLMVEPLGEAKKRFPILATLDEKKLKALTEWKPRRWQAIVTETLRPKDGSSDGDLSDDTLLFWYHKFCRITPDYPDGAEIAVNGAGLEGNGADAGFILTRDTLREDVELEDGSLVPVLMEPPIVQFRSLLDVETGDPFGDTPVKQFGGANEIRAHLYVAALEDIDVRLHPNTFLTSTSNLTREDLSRRDDTPLEVLTKDDMPIFEQRPQPPQYLVPMLERVEKDMNIGANLNETAQALDSSYSASGEAKKVAINQAKVQLAQDWQGFISGYCQYQKVKLQLAQARLKTPQLVRLAGENRAYQSSHFVGSDMVGVSAVSLMPGSGTMMAPAEKAQYIAQFQGQAWIEPDVAGELARSSMSDDLGLPPSPHEEHIDRCIADWLEGPPDGWEEAYQHNQTLEQQTQEYQSQLQQGVSSLSQSMVAGGADPNEAQQLATQHVQGTLGGPPQPVDLPNPFEARANDEEPAVAKIQAMKLSKLMSTVEYKKQPKFWRLVIDEKYQSAAYAAGIVTLRQQQQTQQQGQVPAAWQKFLSAIQEKAIAMAEGLVAKEVVSAGGGSQMPGADSEPAPAPAGPTPEELGHHVDESAKDRQHDMVLAEQKHGHAMKQIAAKTVGQTLAKADRAAAREEGSPTPTPLNPSQS